MIHRRHFLTGSVSLLGATAFRCRSAVGPVDVAAAPARPMPWQRFTWLRHPVPQSFHGTWVAAA